jgi:hypothetical protein
VAGNDVYHAGFSNTLGSALTGVEVFGMGLSANTSKLSFEGEFFFRQPAHAEEYTEERKGQIEQIRERLAREGISEEERDRTEQRLNVMDRLKRSRRDRRVYFQGKWPDAETEDARELVLDAMPGSLPR